MFELYMPKISIFEMFSDFVTKYAYILHENNLGEKVNGAYFRNALVAQHLLLVIRNMAPEGCFIFHQDRVPAHTAR